MLLHNYDTTVLYVMKWHIEIWKMELLITSSISMILRLSEAHDQ